MSPSSPHKHQVPAAYSVRPPLRDGTGLRVDIAEWAHAGEQSAHIGTRTGGTGGKGIYRLRVDKEKGFVGAPELVAEVDDPSFLAAGKDRKKLYAASESSNKVLMYGGADGDGELTLLQTAETGPGPCHLALDYNNWTLVAANDMGGAPWMLVANQHSDNIALFRAADDGALAHVPGAGVEIAAPACVVFE